MDTSEMQLRKVLIIDDDPLTLTNVSTILAKKYKVYCATSGPKAIDIVEANKPDIVLLDYEMPEFDGAVTYEFLKEYPGMGAVPIVFLTGVSDAASVKKLLSLEPAGYLLKPVSKFQLIETVERVIQKYLREN